MWTTVSPYRSAPRDSIVNSIPCLSSCAHTLRCQYAGIVPSCGQHALVMAIFLTVEHFAYLVVFQGVLSLNWLRVFRSAAASRIGPSIGQQRHTRAVWSEKCVGLRGRAWDGHARDRCVFWPVRFVCTDLACISFLPLLQEVRSIYKTRNQFKGNNAGSDGCSPGWC
jgi:hypothetical protein